MFIKTTPFKTSPFKTTPGKKIKFYRGIENKFPLTNVQFS